MLFLEALVVGLGFTFGLEIALGLSRAIRVVVRSSKKNEKR